MIFYWNDNISSKIIFLILSIIICLLQSSSCNNFYIIAKKNIESYNRHIILDYNEKKSSIIISIIYFP